MRRFIGFLLFAPVPVLGILGAAWSWLFGAAAVGVIGYWLIQPVVFTRMRQASVLRRSIFPIASYIVAVYVGQLFVCSVLFLVGRGFGQLLGA
jgi:hypothetical protein